jgi:hypothetical protein
LRRKPETSGPYSFNHPKIGSDSFVRCLAQIFRQSRIDGIPRGSESVAPEDQKADGKIDPPIARSCLTKNFYNTKILGISGSKFCVDGTDLKSAAPVYRNCARMSLFLLALASRTGKSLILPIYARKSDLI